MALNRSEVTSRTLTAFMSGIIDYAGLFPPASLSLDRSIRNFVNYRSHADQWMLSSFVCPASRLVELESYGEMLTSEDRHPFSVLGARSSTLGEWTAVMTKLRVSIDRFHESLGDVAFTRAVEVKLPLAVTVTAEKRRQALEVMYSALSGAPDPLDIFVEISPSGEAEVVETLAHELVDRDRSEARPRTALKIRTGGVTPPEIPDADAVASFLIACRDTGIRFKATAGLHHPLRHFNKSVGSMMHGFVNVFAGSMAAMEHDLSREQLRSILEVEQPDYFTFGDEAVGVGHLKIDRQRVEALRRDFATSFGSCSFDEPRDDLRSIGLL